MISPLWYHGSKLKLVDWIRDTTKHVSYDRWVEPFMGTGNVAFNIQPDKALLCDSNQSIIDLFNGIQSGTITPEIVETFLKQERIKMIETDGQYFYDVRDRYNQHRDPLDFLLLSRLVRNGLVRYNQNGQLNSPPGRLHKFTPNKVQYITNLVRDVQIFLKTKPYTFKCQRYEQTIKESDYKDFIYCDPPYIDRETGYFDAWGVENERRLHDMLVESSCKFVVSTWFNDQHGKINDCVFSVWGEHNVVLKKHKYSMGTSNAKNPNIHEVMITNFQTPETIPIKNLDVNDYTFEASRDLSEFFV